MSPERVELDVVRVPRPYLLASLATLVLATVASGVGLLVPDFYRDAAVLVPQARGQDLLTLVLAIPALAVALFYARRGSLQAYVVWLGVTGYLLYTYASYSVLTAFNRLYLVYLALFTLTLFTLVGGTARLDAAALSRAIGGHSVRAYVAFEVLLAVLVGGMWLAEIVPALATDVVPPSTVEAGIPVNVIQSLDLGVVVPAFLLAAYLLWQRRAWGYAFTGILLVKGTTLGLAVLSMIVLLAADGRTVPAAQVAIFAVLSLLGLVLVVRFVRAIGAEQAPEHGPGPSPWAGKGR